jgi:2-hydroxyacylsphingosine 1-beta-galactosyltransferase
MEDPSRFLSASSHAEHGAHVGDLMAGRPGGPLPDNVEQFLVKSTGGAIIVSFGSFLDHVPHDVLRQFCQAFAGISDASVGIIWKQINQSACDGVAGFDRRRVLLMPWIPQNDLLADARVRLFVTHGGLNSVVEAVYHGKPLVVLPVSLDQPANAAVVAAKGYGVRLNLDSAEPDIATALTTAIHTVLSDGSYAERVRHGSLVMRDRRDTPAERVSYAIDHVIKYGDEHLRTGAFQLSTWQYIMFDLFAAVAAAFVILTCCAGLICRAALRRCCSRRIKEKTA